MIAVRIGCLVGLIGACLAPPAAAAATVEGQPFDDVIKLGTSELVLNGVGVRAVLIFKGYVAALYLSEKSTTRSAVSQTIGSKRLQLRMLRRASAQDFLNALVPGIHQNVDAKELSRLGERINQMEREGTVFRTGVQVCWVCPNNEAAMNLSHGGSKTMQALPYGQYLN